MSKTIITGLIICWLSSTGKSQPASINIDLGFLQNHKGFFQLYDGIVEFGGDYSLALTRDLSAGIAMHAGILNRITDGMSAVFYKPALQITYSFHITQRFAVEPVASAGYSWVSIRNDGYNYKDIQHGVNSGFDLRFRWKTQSRTDFYLFGRYDYIYLDEDKSFTELYYFRKIHQTAFGLGIKIK